jgi:hypothetical protein
VPEAWPWWVALRRPAPHGSKGSPDDTKELERGTRAPDAKNLAVSAFPLWPQASSPSWGTGVGLGFNYGSHHHDHPAMVLMPYW